MVLSKGIRQVFRAGRQDFRFKPTGSWARNPSWKRLFSRDSGIVSYKGIVKTLNALATLNAHGVRRYSQSAKNLDMGDEV